jgi:hypothetical protein
VPGPPGILSFSVRGLPASPREGAGALLSTTNLLLITEPEPAEARVRGILATAIRKHTLVYFGRPRQQPRTIVSYESYESYESYRMLRDPDTRLPVTTSLAGTLAGRRGRPPA